MAHSIPPTSRQVHDTYPRAQRRVVLTSVALPDIMVAFGVSVSTAGWLVTAYLITMAALQDDRS